MKGKEKKIIVDFYCNITNAIGNFFVCSATYKRQNVYLCKFFIVYSQRTFLHGMAEGVAIKNGLKS